MDSVATLVTGAREDRPEAFEQLVRRFQDMAVAYGYSLLRDIGLAEDAAQEAFLEAYLCLEDLREPAAFPGWFRRIVFKQCDRIIRRRKSLDPMEGVFETPVSPVQQSQVEQAELRRQLQSAIESLSDLERETVTMFYIAEHSHAQIAEFLGIQVTTVKKRLFSGRKHLRQKLEAAIAEELRSQRPSRDQRFAEAVIDMLEASRSGDVEKVKALLRRNRRLLTARDWLGNSALIIAINSGQQAIADLLFKAGIQPDIHEAAATGMTERVEALLEQDPSLLDSFSSEGFTPLALAAHFGQVEATELLLERKADSNLRAIHPLQVTPLHAAFFGGSQETARLLIEHGANVNTGRGGAGWPRAGWTALHYAAAAGWIDLLELILAKSGDPTIADEQGKTPVDIAREAGRIDVVELLSA